MTQSPDNQNPSFIPPPTSSTPYKPDATQPPYHQTSSDNQANPYQQTPQQQNPAYQQAVPQQNLHQGGYQQTPDVQYQGYQAYPQSPYPPQAAYQETSQKKAKVWPWILGGCLILALLSLGGCVGCIACTTMIAENEYASNSSLSDEYGDYGDNLLDDLLSEDSGTSNSAYTLSDIEALAEGTSSTIEEGKCSTGVFEVGTSKDIEEGLYYLEGSQTEEGSFMIFEKDATNDTYSISASVVYFGNYFAELSKDSIIVFLAPSNAHLYLAKDAQVELGEKIESGCYRVGTDISAGTYTVTFQTGAPEDANQEAGVYIMNDLSWSADSILESYYLIPGGSHTITVEDGQYLELYEATMVLSNPEATQ